MDKRSIGFFDSGIGGLTVLKDCVKILPNEKYLYFGDNSNAPYGNKTEKEILNLSIKAMQVFKKHDCKMVVIACNTITISCIKTLRKMFDFPIIGMEPAVKVMLNNSQKTNRLVIATNRTINHLQKNSNLKNISFLALKNLAKDIELNYEQLNIIDLKELNEFIVDNQINSIVLGCTHYLYLLPILTLKYPHITFFDGNEGTVNHIKRTLLNKCLYNCTKKTSVCYFGTSKFHNYKIFNAKKP